MTTYRAAVIGLGRMGSTFDDEIDQGGSIFLPYCHAPSYDAAPNVELVAGADLHDGQREIFGKRWDISPDHLYADYREMIAREQLDLISVCTTARVRSRIVQDVARSGVGAIWAEKPIALSLQEADDMVRACEENDVRLAVYCGRRWNPLFHKAREMIQAGEIGDVLHVAALARAGLSHNGSHSIDILRYLAGGDVEWVFGEIESDEAAAGDDDPRGNGYLAFDNGARGYLRSTDTGAANWEVDVVGTRAASAPPTTATTGSSGGSSTTARPVGVVDRMPSTSRSHGRLECREWVCTRSRTSCPPSRTATSRGARATTDAPRWRSPSRCASRTAAAASRSRSR